MVWDLSFGERADKFGARDYTGNLGKIWDQYEAGPERQKKLMKARQDMLSWMRDNTDQVAERNRSVAQGGVEGGLYDRIAKGEQTHTWRGQNMDINPETERAYSEESANYYGLADALHDRASGRSWSDMKKYLDANSGLLRHGNVPGGGGLYDDIATQSRFQDERNTWSDSLSGLEDQFTTGMQKHTKELSGAFSTGMGGVSDAITKQTQAEEKYRADQANWQRRQENMQQMMIQEGRRKAKEKPVMAVMPGQGAYGGGAGGASSFARKKKQTTGLNIA